ncbi:hypothetical protein E4U58_006741 [Claviceps cyperi]|nr:hypothetical protein E4U58_006741 [Claviceps cyperi]
MYEDYDDGDDGTVLRMDLEYFEACGLGGEDRATRRLLDDGYSTGVLVKDVETREVEWG